MQLALFDLDNTLLAGDSDYEWTQHLINKGVLDRDTFERRNAEFFEQYKAGTLNIFEFLDFQLQSLSRHRRADLDAWHAEFMAERIRPMIGRKARDLVARHQEAGEDPVPALLARQAQAEEIEVADRHAVGPAEQGRGRVVVEIG